jgi:hypothetical protein
MGFFFLIKKQKLQIILFVNLLSENYYYFGINLIIACSKKSLKI